MVSEISAKAKVNLHLQILNRRSDGYHNIFSLMTHTGLADLLKLEEIDLKKNSGSVEVICRNIDGPFAGSLINIPPSSSTITRAVEAFCDAASLSGKVILSVVKNIPSGGGLGGGSADAAAIINELNRLTGALTQKEILAAAVKVGADVAFCLLNRGSAFCEGIGEIIEPVEVSIKLPLLIINDGTEVNTSKAYGLLKRPVTDDALFRTNFDIDNTKVLIKNLLKSGDIESLSKIIRNDFEEPVFNIYPGLKLLKQKVLDSGALTSIMSGSGSTIIGLYRSMPEAVNSAEALKKNVKTVILTDFT